MKRELTSSILSRAYVGRRRCLQRLEYFYWGDRYWEPSSFIWIKQSNQHPFTMTPTMAMSYQLANEMHQISCPPLCRFIVLGIPQRSSLWSLFYGNISLVCHLHAYLVTHWSCACMRSMRSNEATFFCWWRNALYCLFCSKTIPIEGSSNSLGFSSTHKYDIKFRTIFLDHVVWLPSYLTVLYVWGVLRPAKEIDMPYTKF